MTTRPGKPPSIEKMRGGNDPIFRYRVRGVVSPYSPFPLDMLRYDRAWPTYEREIDNLTRMPGDERADVTISITGHACTIERWQSFGWIVL